MGRIAGTEIICPETLRVPLLLVVGVVCFIFYLFTWYKYSNCFSYYKLFPVSIPFFVQSCSIDKKESLLPLGSESLLPISPLRILSPRSPPPHKIPPEEEVSPLPPGCPPLGLGGSAKRRRSTRRRRRGRSAKRGRKGRESPGLCACVRSPVVRGFPGEKGIPQRDRPPGE